MLLCGGSAAKPYELSATLKEMPDWIKKGCGDEPYYCEEKEATFARDGKTPDKMPDLSKHTSFMADALKNNPGLWDKLKDKKTKNGVTLAQCIKTGIDNKGHPHIKIVGMTAGDEESYEVFKELFDPVISARHGGYAADAIQPTNLDINKILDIDIDPECKYVLTTRVRTGRSIRGFKLPPLIGYEERNELEKLVTGALLKMDGDLAGDYFPLHGSTSYAAKPKGMSHEKENELRSCGNLFQEPDSTLLLASGMARHWPHGRGVFHNKNSDLFIWVGEEDHMRIVSMQGDLNKPTQRGKQIKEVVARFIRACDEVQKVLKAAGKDFMWNKHHGWVLTCPCNLGTGLRCGSMMRLPGVSSRPDWKVLMDAMRLQARGKGGVDSDSKGGIFDVSNADRIGKGEIDLVNTLIKGAAQLVKWETMYDNGKKDQANKEIDAVIAAAAGGADEEKSSGEYKLSDTLKDMPNWIKAGCGDKPYFCEEKEATFAPDGKTPDKMPDLSKHSSFMADALKANPKLWDQLKDKVTKNGVTLAQCIKTGIDNKGHPHIKIVGMTAGDEESYEVFKDLFDPVISARHGGYDKDAVQPTNLDMSKISDTDIDPDCKYVLTTRVRTGRSIRGFKLPPLIGYEERNELEALVTKALLEMDGDLAGDYYPLFGSTSYKAKPNGMSHEKETELRSCGNLFQEPDSTLLLASGMARHWPNGRGVFHNKNSDLFIWVGEEDHMRIVSMQGDLNKPTKRGKQIKEVVSRFIKACDAVQKVLKANGKDFMWNKHHGWVLTCPSNLGTGLRCGSMMVLPKISARKDWKTLIGAMRLQARGKGGVDSDSKGGIFDISNADRIGKGEIDLVNTLIEGAAQLVKWEKMYDNGKEKEADEQILAKIAAAKK